MKIGILYVGIGKYIRLWDKFYSSCESLFLPQYEKKYFIFTDYPLKAALMYKFRSRKIWAGPKCPVPLPNVPKAQRRTQTFWLSVLFNGNTEFLQIITPEEFYRPRKRHWPVWNGTPIETNHCEISLWAKKNSQAYIPYNSGEHYYQGGLIGGESKAYIELLEQCSLMTETDLKETSQHAGMMNLTWTNICWISKLKF